MSENLKKEIADCEQTIAQLEDPRWLSLMEAIRLGSEVNRRQYQGEPYAEEIILAVEQDYLLALRCILDVSRQKPV